VPLPQLTSSRSSLVFLSSSCPEGSNPAQSLQLHFDPS
jgi:hypothetical protein